MPTRTWRAPAERSESGYFDHDADIGIVGRGASIEAAFVAWLNALLAIAHIDDLVFCRFALRREGERWIGQAWGQPWRGDLERGIEVKGATLTELSVRQDGNAWLARCVVDV